jgi:hypothetical protein
MTREVQMNTGTDRLACQTRSPTPWQEGESSLLCRPDAVDDIIRISGRDDTGRIDLVDAGVIGVQYTRHIIVADLTLQPATKLLDSARSKW